MSITESCFALLILVLLLLLMMRMKVILVVIRIGVLISRQFTLFCNLLLNCINRAAVVFQSCFETQSRALLLLMPTITFSVVVALMMVLLVIVFITTVS